MMKAQDVIKELDRMTNNGIVVYKNTVTDSDISIIKEHGIFKLLFQDFAGIIYFDGYKKNMFSDVCINMFNKDNEIARIGVGHWERVE